MSLCEENCTLVDYDYVRRKAICSCDIKISMPDNYDIKFNKKDFLKSFLDIKNIMNLNILKCYKIVLTVKSLIKNYGFFIIFFILLLYFITLIYFTCKSYRKLKKIIDKTFLTLNNAKETKKIIKDTKQERIINKLHKNTKQNRKSKSSIENFHSNNYSNEIKLENKRNRNKNRKKKEREKNISKQITKSFEYNCINKMKNGNESININDKNVQGIKESKGFELNSLEYKEALK